MSRRNHLTRENALKLKAVLAEKISQMHRIFYSVNYAVPWNEHVGIFSPQIALKPAFSQLYSFSFKFITSVSENYFELNKETSREIDRKRNWEYKQDTTKGWRSKRQLFYPFRWLIYVFNSVVNTKLPAKSFVVEFWRYVFDLHRLSLRAFKSLITMSNLREINELLHRFLGWVPSGSHHPCFFLLTVLKLYGSFINYRITRTFL